MSPEQLFELEKMKIEMSAKREEEERKLKREERVMEREREKEKHELEMSRLSLPSDSSEAHLQRTSEAKVKMELPEYRESEDVVDYLATVERLCTAYGWRRDTWATRMASKLSGKAREAYARMDVSSVSDFDAVKSAILAKYRLTTEEYRSRFRDLKKNVRDTYEEYRVALNEAFERWKESAKVKTVEEMQDLIVTEHLLNMLPGQLCQWILQQQPTSSTEITRLCDVHHDSVVTRNGKDSGKYISTVNNDVLKYMPKCFHCKGDHLKRNCPLLAGASGKGEVKCFYCSGKHYKRDCPRFKNSNTVEGNEKAGAVSAHSLQNELLVDYYRPGLINGCPATLLRDSGCTLTIVHRRFVNDQDILDESVMIQWIDDTGKRIPLARVQICGFGVDGYFIVGYLNNLNEDCYLGNDVTNKKVG
ncbi:Uncharacterised protein r2_g2558 [Pycnogonum litorale]